MDALDFWELLGYKENEVFLFEGNAQQILGGSLINLVLKTSSLFLNFYLFHFTKQLRKIIIITVLGKGVGN